MSSIRYQPHIDGLRAVAVLPVIIFHFNNAWLPGGFVGVDIFFVISGFLITSIMITEHRTSKFSFSKFYLRRVKRILPAIFLVATLSLLAGYFLMLPDDYVYLERSVRSTLYFGSNFYFMGVGDYFSPTMYEMPLLHTWSLAVEEQFYLLWPLLLFYLLRYTTKHVLLISFLLLTASFSLSVTLVLSKELAAASYYLLPSRMWELLAGGLLAILIDDKTLIKRLKYNTLLINLLSTLAVVLLVYSFVFITKSTAFPGYQAIFPVLGTVFLILIGYLSEGNHFLLNILRSKLFVGIGVISYALYLWHWPIFAFVRYILVDNTITFFWGVITLTLTFVCSLISYRLVEQPCRTASLTLKKSIVLFYFLPILLILSFTLWMKYSQDRNTFQIDKNKAASSKQFKALCNKQDSGKCILGDTSFSPNTLLIGDSHAKHLVKFFDDVGKNQAWSMKVLASPSCAPVNKMDFSQTDIKVKYQKLCIELIEKLPKLVDEVDVIILSLRWSRYPFFAGGMEGEGYFIPLLKEQIKQWTNQDKKVILTSLIPSYEKPVERFEILNFSETNGRIDDYLLYNEKLKLIAESFEKVYFLDTAKTAESFKNGLHQGISVYYDTNHLNFEGSKILAELMLINGELKWLSRIIKPDNDTE